MKVLITGAQGFIGKNLRANIEARCGGLVDEVFLFDKDSTKEELESYCKLCNFVFHLAGVNRPKDESEFAEGNAVLTSTVVGLLEKHDNKCPILLSSSTQAAQDNSYGKSKKLAEDIVFEHGRIACSCVCVYRLPGVFGKWCRPNYNSVVATFCDGVANNKDIQVNGRGTKIELVYIDDVVDEFLHALEGCQVAAKDGFCKVPVVHETTLGRIIDLLNEFKEGRETLSVPNTTDPFEKKLYSTYLSYLPKKCFSYPLKMNIDGRGSFTEVIKTLDRGQFSVNVAKPKITKGQHWHNTKNEKFLVVSGSGIIRFRKVGCTEVVEYRVSGDRLEVVDIPCGYTHSIENIGDTDMVTLMWCNEFFDPENPDTFWLEV